jgi:hypothetical protein
MKTFVDVMVKTFVLKIQSTFKSEEIWDTTVLDIRPRIGECLKVIKYFENSIKEYTRLWDPIRKYSEKEFHLK